MATLSPVLELVLWKGDEEEEVVVGDEVPPSAITVPHRRAAAAAPAPVYSRETYAKLDKLLLDVLRLQQKRPKNGWVVSYQEQRNIETRVRAQAEKRKREPSPMKKRRRRLVKTGPPPRNADGTLKKGVRLLKKRKEKSDDVSDLD